MLAAGTRMLTPWKCTKKEKQTESRIINCGLLCLVRHYVATMSDVCWAFLCWAQNKMPNLLCLESAGQTMNTLRNEKLLRTPEGPPIVHRSMGNISIDWFVTAYSSFDSLFTQIPMTNHCLSNWFQCRRNVFIFDSFVARHSRPIEDRQISSFTSIQ